MNSLNPDDEKLTSINEVFARNLKNYRNRKGLSQKELADRIGYCQSYIAMVETSARNTNIQFMERTCEILEVSPNDLLNYKTSPTITNYDCITDDDVKKIVELYSYPAISTLIRYSPASAINYIARGYLQARAEEMEEN